MESEAILACRLLCKCIRIYKDQNEEYLCAMFQLNWYFFPWVGIYPPLLTSCLVTTQKNNKQLHDPLYIERNPQFLERLFKSGGVIHWFIQVFSYFFSWIVSLEMVVRKLVDSYLFYLQSHPWKRQGYRWMPLLLRSKP